MQFDWDEAKRRSNLKKHGLDFADASRVFDCPLLVYEDSRYDYSEHRMIAVGMIEMVVVVIVHTQVHDTIRIISMRKGDRHETLHYFTNAGLD